MIEKRAKKLSIKEALALASQYESRKDFQRAVSAYDAVLRVMPKQKAARDGKRRCQNAVKDQLDLQQLDILLNSGKFGDALQAATRLCKTRPDTAFAPNVAGIALAQQGQHDRAIPFFEEALRRDAKFGAAHVNLSTSLRLTGQRRLAVEHAQHAVAIDPKNAQFQTNLGLAFQDISEVDEAMACFRTALEMNPKDATAHDGLCGLLEQMSELAQMQDALETAAEHLGDKNPIVAFWRGIYHARNSNTETALEIFDAMSVDSLPLEKRAKYWAQKGKLHDSLGDAEAAFAAFEACNSNLKQRSMTGSALNPYLAQVRKDRDQLQAAKVLDWQSSSDAAPVFMVGFPRSGTTLLDTILRGHPEIDVIEEQPLVDAMKVALDGRTDLDSLTHLKEEQIRLAEAAYFSWRDEAAQSNARVIIDKLPLNMNQVILIHRIFPKAKYIMSVRHPCDCVLSCLMQSFRSNYAMDNFLDLRQAAQLYDASMELWQTATKRFELDHINLKYEDLITDQRGQIQRVLDHLGLDWDERVMDHTASAKARKEISTPSRGQVTKKIYRDAAGRWKRYEKHLAPALPHLEPWIAHWGYPLHTSE